MTDKQHASRFQRVSASAATGMSRGRRWFNQVVTGCSHPRVCSKPDWVRLPDRVWSRQSALLVSLHQREREV